MFCFHVPLLGVDLAHIAISYSKRIAKVAHPRGPAGPSFAHGTPKSAQERPRTQPWPSLGTLRPLMCALSPHQMQQKALLKFSKIFAQISKYLKIKLTNPGIQGRSANPRWYPKTNHLVSGASHTHKKHNWRYNFYFSIHL